MAMARPATAALQAEEKKNKEKFWLFAFRDHLANVRAFTGCIETADVYGDGDYKLLIADGSKRLKMYGGTALQSESRLLNVPSAITSFYMNCNDAFHRPVVAVAIGPYVFMYRNNKPMYRFTVPLVALSEEEQLTWSELAAGSLSMDEAVRQLERKLDEGVDVSGRTLELLLMDSDAERQAFLERVRDKPLHQFDTVTCLASINCDKLEEGADGCLVVGTERRVVYVLNREASGISLRLQLPSTPVSFITAGCVDSDYRIIIWCRDGRIYSIKNGRLSDAVIQPDAQPSCIARYDNWIAVATTNHTLTYYNLKGKRQLALFLPVSVTNLATITDPVTGAARALVVALSNGELRIYVGKSLLHTSQVYGTVTAMLFGRYGRELSALVLVLQNGSLVVELLHRRANFTAERPLVSGPPPEQDMPIPVPKLSAVFAVQTEREKKFGIDMYRSFQYDLCRLRLKASKAYLGIISDAEVAEAVAAASPALQQVMQIDDQHRDDVAASPVAAGAESSSPEGGGADAADAAEATEELGLRIVASVQGLGPVFKIKALLQNVGDVAIRDLSVVFLYDPEAHEMPQTVFYAPYLVPSMSYPLDALVKLREGETKGDGIVALGIVRNRERPLATTIIDLPEAELIDAL